MLHLLWNRSHGTTSRWHILCRDPASKYRTVVFGIPRSASSSCTISHQSLLNSACTCSTFSHVLRVAGLLECGLFSTDSWPSLKHLCHTLLALHSLHHPQKPPELLDSFHGGMFKLNTKFDADSLLYFSVMLNAIAMQYTCSLNSVYHPHWLVQWSHHCSHITFQCTLFCCQVT